MSAGKKVLVITIVALIVIAGLSTGAYFLYAKGVDEGVNASSGKYTMQDMLNAAGEGGDVGVMFRAYLTAFLTDYAATHNEGLSDERLQAAIEAIVGEGDFDVNLDGVAANLKAEMTAALSPLSVSFSQLITAEKVNRSAYQTQVTDYGDNILAMQQIDPLSNVELLTLLKDNAQTSLNAANATIAALTAMRDQLDGILAALGEGE